MILVSPSTTKSHSSCSVFSCSICFYISLRLYCSSVWSAVFSLLYILSNWYRLTSRSRVVQIRFYISARIPLLIPLSPLPSRRSASILSIIDFKKVLYINKIVPRKHFHTCFYCETQQRQLYPSSPAINSIFCFWLPYM